MKRNCYFFRLFFVITVILFHVIYCASVATESDNAKKPDNASETLQQDDEKLKPGGDDEKDTLNTPSEGGDSKKADTPNMTTTKSKMAGDKDSKMDTAIDESKHKLPTPVANKGTGNQVINNVQSEQPKGQSDDKGMDSEGGGTKTTATLVTKKNATTVVAPTTSKTIANPVTNKQMTSTKLPDTTMPSFVDKDVSDDKEKGLGNGFEGDAADPTDDENKEDNDDAEVVKVKQDETVKSQISSDVSTEKKKAAAEEPPIIFPEQENSHFFAYFITVVVVCVLGYFLLHNKQKIMALIIEGRHNRKRRSHSYRKLEDEGSKGAAQPIF